MAHMNDGTGASNDEILERSQRQFGTNAANYATSVVHAKGASLGRLVEIVDPQPTWHGLDIASAAGHTAFAMAEHVESIVVTDATHEMLEVATSLAAERGISNVSFEFADAHDLPFDDDEFDLVTCRIAPHHFADPDRFVTEVARVLRPGGVFGLVDNVSPEDPAVAQWCDDFERRRDPSHLRCLPVSEWITLLDSAGFDDVSVETMGKHMDFAAWADNMSVPDEVRTELLAMLAEASVGATAWLRPTLDGDPAFVLTEGLFRATAGA